MLSVQLASHGAGQMRFAPAVAIPVRVRSHFDAQDVLENGGEGLRAQSDGWLNRALVAAGGRQIAELDDAHENPDVAQVGHGNPLPLPRIF